MAQKTVVQWLDDLDGGPAEDTVEFGLDGVDYELDLSADNAAALREALATYIAHARSQGRRGSRRGARQVRASPPPSKTREQSRAIRQWARRHGYTVNVRGRISDEITEAYHRHAGAPSTPSTPARPTSAVACAGGAEGTSDDGVTDGGASADGGQSGPVGLDGLTVEDRERIRFWAQQEGIQVKPRGRLSRDLIANYRATKARQDA